MRTMLRMQSILFLCWLFSGGCAEKTEPAQVKARFIEKNVSPAKKQDLQPSQDNANLRNPFRRDVESSQPKRKRQAAP